MINRDAHLREAVNSNRNPLTGIKTLAIMDTIYSERQVDSMIKRNSTNNKQYRENCPPIP
ncbi:MAG: hypothetical protein ACLVML_05285 [Candidatus Gastranaerophilaceae bacterium]|mgnify:CR=1|jgi:hypothetical protein|nr:hypothetical protein [Christensenellales bacterium]